MTSFVYPSILSLNFYLPLNGMAGGHHEQLTWTAVAQRFGDSPHLFHQALARDPTFLSTEEGVLCSIYR